MGGESGEMREGDEKAGSKGRGGENVGW